MAQTTSDAENAALQQQLLTTSEDVARMERSMRDIVTLNQMFSAQVVHQSEQIEHIYGKVRYWGAVVPQRHPRSQHDPQHLACRYSAGRLFTDDRAPARRNDDMIVPPSQCGPLRFLWWDFHEMLQLQRKQMMHGRNVCMTALARAHVQCSANTHTVAGMQAVETSMNLTRGNTQLRKALRHSQAARKYVLVLLLAASLSLLFLDWYYSGRLAKRN